MLEKKQNELDYLSKLNFKGAYGELQKYLEIDKPKKYRDKMKGFINNYYDDTEKIERYDLLTKEEISVIKEKVEKFKKMREDNEKEKESLKEKKKKELYEIKKVGFIENNKRLLKRIKEKEVKKTYMMLKQKQKKINEQKCIININRPTEELKVGLDKDDMKLLNIDEDEENSDEDILEKYGVPKSKKVTKKELKTINDINKAEEKEIKDIQSNTSNINNKNIDNLDINNIENNTNNKTITNDIFSVENDSKSNDSVDIMTLKQNLKPKKKENIYFSSNIKKEEVKDSDKEDKQKLEKETEKKEEKEKKDKNEEVMKTINKDENKNKQDMTEGIYLTEPDVNKLRKNSFRTKNLSPKKTLTGKIIQLRSRNISNSLEIRKKINKDILTKINENTGKETIEEKGYYLFNSPLKKVKPINELSQNKSFDKLLIKKNNIKNKKDMNIINHINSDKKSLNSIKKYKIDSFFNKGIHMNNPVIKLPSVNKFSSINIRNNVTNNRNDGVIFLPGIKTQNNLDNNNVIILPGMNSSNNIETINELNNKENPSSENERYLLLFQKNYKRDSKINRTFRSNNIKLSEEKEKKINLNRKSNQSPIINNKKNKK